MLWQLRNRWIDSMWAGTMNKINKWKTIAQELSLSEDIRMTQVHCGSSQKAQGNFRKVWQAFACLAFVFLDPSISSPPSQHALCACSHSNTSSSFTSTSPFIHPFVGHWTARSYCAPSPGVDAKPRACRFLSVRVKCSTRPHTKLWSLPTTSWSSINAFSSVWFMNMWCI